MTQLDSRTALGCSWMGRECVLSPYRRSGGTVEIGVGLDR